MSNLHESLHQPPNPEDLRRVPPANPACARIRGLLRDYVDADLGSDLSAEVEEHVHRCRVCAVELSRSEHERLMVCRAFAALAHAQPSTAPGFSDRVLQRLMDETSLGSARDAAAAAGKPVSELVPANPPGPATSPGPGPGPGTGLWAGLEAGRHRLLLTGLLVLLCASMVFSWGMAADREPERSARLVLTDAYGAYGVEGRELKQGDGLGDDQFLWVGAKGTARFEWHDVSSLRQPAATLDLRGGGEVRLQNGAPLLVNGKVGVVTNRPVEIPMADGSSLRLGKGEYVIEVPNDWLKGLDQKPDSPFARDLVVKVEVLSGQELVIRRSVGTDVVAAGTIGVYEGSSTVIYHPGSFGLTSNQGTVPERRSPGEGSPNQTNFAGMVVDRFGYPSGGASVGLSFRSAGMTRHLTLVSESDGSFSETTDCGCDRMFAIVQVEPAADRMDLGVTPPQAMPVIRLQSNVQLATSLVLHEAAPLQGRVLDDLEVPRSDVRVLPCIVDELFGTVLPLMSGQITTEVGGSFQIKRLPSRLPRHQHLAVLLLDPQLEPTLVPVPERGSDLGNEWWVPLTMVAKRLHAVQLRDLTENAQVEIFEEVPGLRGESAVVKRMATTNSNGRVNIMIGSGRLWWRRGTLAYPTVRELVRGTSPSSSLPRYYPTPSSVPLQPLHNVFRPMADIGGTDLRLAQSYRHQVLGADTASTASSSESPQTLLVVDSLGHAVADAQVFSLEATGPRGSVQTKFHGFTSPGGFPLAGVAPASYLYVLGPDGAAGQVTMGTGPFVHVGLVPTGSVLVGASLRPTGSEPAILTVRFERLGLSTAGMRPVAVRFTCADRDWVVNGLPPGAYRAVIGENVREIEVPAGGFIPMN